MFSAMLYKAGEILIKSYAKFMLEIDIHWKTELPDVPVLYAANHPSTTDPIFIHLISPRPISVMIASKVFSIPVLGAYMRRMQQISVVPGQGERVLEEARHALEKGRSVMIFPEGLSAGRMPSPSAIRSGSMVTRTTSHWSRRLPKPSCNTSATWRKRAGRGYR